MYNYITYNGSTRSERKILSSKSKKTNVPTDLGGRKSEMFSNPLDLETISLGTSPRGHHPLSITLSL